MDSYWITTNMTIWSAAPFGQHKIPLLRQMSLHTNQNTWIANHDSQFAAYRTALNGIWKKTRNTPIFKSWILPNIQPLRDLTLLNVADAHWILYKYVHQHHHAFPPHFYAGSIQFRRMFCGAVAFACLWAASGAGAGSRTLEQALLSNLELSRGLFIFFFQEMAVNAEPSTYLVLLFTLRRKRQNTNLH